MLTDTGSTAKNSMSILRQPGPLSASVRGDSTNYPFLPGKKSAGYWSNKFQIHFDDDGLALGWLTPGWLAHE